ncbi:MAG: ABC transporter ATP-binding protein [Ilumatobacteraceae bacterium]
MRLEARDITVRFGTTTVLDRVSLTLDSEMVGLLGPSGSGKSTLLKAIAGLVVPDAGSVFLDGSDVSLVPPHRRGIGMVFQNQQLFPHLDVGENVAFGLRMRGQRKADMSDRVSEMLHLVGLAGFERRRVGDLSGGEATRVALARALAPSPSVLLLDEPLAGLDRDLHDRLAGELHSMLAHTTGLLVTHDRAEAATIASRVVSLADLAHSAP